MEKELTLKSYVVFMKAAKAVQERIRHDINQYGLGVTEFAVLEVLHHKGKQTVQQIANSVLLASGSMTYVIDKLQQKGLLERSDCREDRRVVHVTITEQGKLLMDQVFPEHQKVIQSLFGEVNAEEKQMLITVLKRVGLKASSS